MEDNTEFENAWGETDVPAAAAPPDALQPVGGDEYVDAWASNDDGVLERAVKAAGVAPVVAPVEDERNPA